MSVTTNFDPKNLPNLPGFRPRPARGGFKKHCFDLVNGESVLRSKYIIAPNESDDVSVTSIGNTIVTKARKHILTDQPNIILNFLAFFEETQDLRSNTPQIRYCNIYFYVENGTMKVVEKPQSNAGLTQGTLVRRTVVAKPDGTPYSEEDFQTGNIITIYGRHYKIYDADNATKSYMKDVFGIEETPLPNNQVPQDPYMQTRKSLEAGAPDTWDKFRSKRNDSKAFNEATLGNSVNNSGREGFIKFANTTLKFRCVWDDTTHLYGDVIEFTLSYYLADDTIEIVSIPSALSKETTRLKLLKRSKLPKDFHTTTGLGARPPTDSFFHYSDFDIGMELEVYGRRLRVIDADTTTRLFFEQQGHPLGASIIPPKAELVVHEREVPPPTGFGSEEDSLRSVAGSLMPGPPPVKKMGENKVLSFLCSLLSGGIDDVDRRFVLTYYVQDNTMKVVEPPVRNSGFTGGVFLSRRAVKKQHGAETISDKDLYLGCRLKVLMHEFLLLETDEGTLRWMEDKGVPKSNVYMILDRLRPVLYNDAISGRLSDYFRSVEVAPGIISQDGFRQVMYSTYGLFNEQYPEQGLTEHEIKTIVRAASKHQGGSTFDHERFVRQIVSPTDEYK